MWMARQKNTESYFIGKTLKMLRRDWLKGIVVSYADKEYGHSGVIYKASNFKMVGEVKGAKVIILGNKKIPRQNHKNKVQGRVKTFCKKS